MTVADVLGKDYTGETYDGSINLNNKGLTSLKGSPKIVKGDFDCSNNELKTLKYSPKIVKGNFNCYNNKLVNLKGSPESVSLDFYCNHNLLESLEGCPKYVGGYFNCASNKLKTLKGAPTYLYRGGFDCSYNFDLKYIKYAPKMVKYNFVCTDCQKLVDIDFEFEKIGLNLFMYNNNSLSLYQKINFLFKNAKKIRNRIFFHKDDELNASILFERLIELIREDKKPNSIIKTMFE